MTVFVTGNILTKKRRAGVDLRAQFKLSLRHRCWIKRIGAVLLRGVDHTLVSPQGVVKPDYRHIFGKLTFPVFLLAQLAEFHSGKFSGRYSHRVGSAPDRDCIRAHSAKQKFKRHRLKPAVSLAPDIKGTARRSCGTAVTGTVDDHPRRYRAQTSLGRKDHSAYPAAVAFPVGNYISYRRAEPKRHSAFRYHCIEC